MYYISIYLFIYLTACELSCSSGYVLDSTKCMCNLCESQSSCDNGICTLLSQPDEYFCNCTGTGLMDQTVLPVVSLGTIHVYKQLTFTRINKCTLL